MASSRRPKAVHQLTAAQFDKMFPVGDEDACKAYLKARRWPQGVRCPRCGNPGVYDLPSRKWHWQCEKCAPDGYRFSVTVGTIFENTNKPLRDWYKVAHLMLTSKKGISARQLWRYMGFGSLKTAWGMAHKIRIALYEPQEKLGGIVEVDETFTGGKNKNRHWDKKQHGTGGPGSGKHYAGGKEYDDCALQGGVIGAAFDLLGSFSPETWTAIATIVIASFTCTLWLATSRQARLTKEAIDLGKEEFLATHRPKIRVRMVTIRPLKEGRELEVQYNVTNVGESEATIIWARASIQTVPPDHLDWSPTSIELGAGEHYPAKAAIKAGQTLLMGPIECHGIRHEGRSKFRPDKLVVRGEVFYRDKNEIERRTSFERIYDERSSGRDIHRYRIPDEPDPNVEYED